MNSNNKNKHNKRAFHSNNDSKSHKPVIARYPILVLSIVLIILFQIIWNFYMHEPYRKTDITTETVQTMLQEGFSNNINPMTGQPYTDGAPTRFRILVLPYVYAVICKITGILPQTLLYEWVPALVLIGSYIIYARFAAYLFKGNAKKQCLFMLFTALLYQFGNYAPVTDSFRLFHTGYEGTTIRAAILLPLALLSCLKGKWWLAAVCAIIEAAVVWTFYGFGYTVLIIAVTIAIRSFTKLYEKRRKTE